MQCSHLIDQVSADKALRDFLGALGTGSALQRFLERCRALHGTRERTHFPAFNLFLGDTYKWFVYRPAVGVAEFLQVYEQFADRPLGAVENPGEIACRVYKGNSRAAHRTLTYLKHDDQWMSPARILAAAALWLGGEVEANDRDTVRIRLGVGLIEVGRNGCWSNVRRQTHIAHCGAFDQDWPATSFPNVSVADPILQALQEACVEMDHRMQYVGTTLALALNEEIIDRAWLRERVYTGQPASGPTHQMQAAERAAVECTRILEQIDGDVLRNLYDSAVPNLMSSQQFRSQFGSQCTGRAERVPRPATVQRWQRLISEALHAK